MKLKTTNEEILKGKFSKTIAKIEAYKTEAKNDISTRVDYKAQAVFSRIEKIQILFEQELLKLANDIEE